jgi:hypothetical protein
MLAVTSEAPRPGIGHNGAPEPTPYEKAREEIVDLFSEASLWLDGAKVTSQAHADDLSNLLNMIRAAEKRAEEARKAEKKPHDDAAKAVQEKYKPLLTKAELAADACKKALSPWLAQKEAEQRAAAELARAEAEAKARAAQEAIRAAEATNLAEREAAEALVKDAKKAGRIASKADKATAQAGGTIGRAIGLKTVYVATMTDAREAARHYWQSDPEEFHTLLQTLAMRDVRSGKREIPGFEIREEKRAV